MKLDSYLEEDLLDDNGKNIEDNPIIYSHYLNVINDLKEEQFEGYKKVSEYYDVNILEDLNNRIVNNVYNYFIDEKTNNYNDIEYSLYCYLIGKEFDIGSLIIEKINDHVSKIDFYNPKDNKKIVDKLEKKKKLVMDCTFLSSDDKEKIIKIFEDFKIKNAKHEKDNTINMILTIIMVVVEIYAIFVAGRYAILFGLYNGFLKFMIFVGIVITIIFTFFMSFMDNNLFKKILQVIFIMGFLLVPLKLNKPIKDEVQMREGKYRIEIRINDEKKYLFLKEGEQVPLDQLDMAGYVFNGWVKDSYYINTPAYVTEKELYIADLEEITDDLATVTFKFNNGQGNFVIKTKINTTPCTPEPPVKEGYRFAGWYDEYTHELYPSRFNVKYDNVVVSAKWEKE